MLTGLVNLAILGNLAVWEAWIEVREYHSRVVRVTPIMTLNGFVVVASVIVQEAVDVYPVYAKI